MIAIVLQADTVARSFRLRPSRATLPAMVAACVAIGSSGCSGTSYTRLISPVPDITTPVVASLLFKRKPDQFSAKVGPRQTVTVGDILLCTVGKPGTVRITSIRPQHSNDPPVVVEFATRPNPVLEDPPGIPFGFNRGTLRDNGFRSISTEVTACAHGYEHVLPANREATTELGITFARGKFKRAAADGLQLTYRSGSGPERTLTVPIGIALCAETVAVCPYALRS